MKILIATGIFRPEVGGPATYAAELARRLKSIGHTVEIVTYSDKPAYDFDKDYNFPITRVTRSGNKVINYFRYFLVISRLARKFDVIYSLDWFSAGFPVMLAARFRGKKYAVRIGGDYIWEKYLSDGHDSVTLEEFYSRKLFKTYKIINFMIGRVIKHAAHVIFNSDRQRELYENAFELGSDKTSTVYNALPDHKFKSLMQTYHAEIALRDKEIVYAGRFSKVKNVESLVRAFARIKDPTYKLLLIGSGPTENELHKIVEELSLEGKVSFLKPMSASELYRRIANCSFVVIPSWSDISPAQAYECMSLGIPFLITKENYLSINEHEFLKIDPSSVDDIAEKMNLLLNPDEYKEFAMSLRALSFNQTWDDIVVEHLRIFSKLI